MGTVQCRTRKKELNKNVESKPCRCWELPDCPFRLASGTSATIGPINPDSATSVLVAEQMMDEEQISEVSLVTFHLFDNERVGPQRPRTRPTLISQGACGADLYYPQNSPLLADQSISQRRRPEPGRYVQRIKRQLGRRKLPAVDGLSPVPTVVPKAAQGVSVRATLKRRTDASFEGASLSTRSRVRPLVRQRRASAL